jgi:hypothetical protein
MTTNNPLRLGLYITQVGIVVSIGSLVLVVLFRVVVALIHLVRDRNKKEE